MNSPYNNSFADSTSTAALNPVHSSQANLPTNKTQFNPHANFGPDSSSEPYQRWDDNGNAVGYSGDPNLMFAPKPARAVGFTPGSDRHHSEDDVGYQYPMSEVGRDGRVVIRQHSDDSTSSDHHAGRGYGVPQVASSPSPTENYPNPFTQPPPIPTLTQSDPSSGRSAWTNQHMQPSSQSQSPYSTHPPPPPLPSMSPTAAARVYSPPPPSYRTDTIH